MQTTAITEIITTLTEAERRFNLYRTEEERFFPEWYRDLPDLQETEKTALNECNFSISLGALAAIT